jgi:serpin B
LHLPKDILKIREEYQNIYSEMNKPNKPYKLSTANALWAQQDYPFSETYFNNIEKYYNGYATNLDFVKDTEGSRITINDWVQNKTYDRIKNLIPKGVVTQDTRLVLTNTIYFKANWSLQFNARNTDDQTFKLGSGNEVKTRMMHQTDNFNYGESDEAQILEMNYLGDDLSMLVILPKGEINDYEKTLSYDKIEKMKNDSKVEKVIVSLPKFKFETKYFMSDALIKMGMPTAFDSEKADFSLMLSEDTNKRLYISQVIHQTFIEVAEYGTEAAAATAVVMVESIEMPPKETPKILNADHPFIFIIQQKKTGNILFIGRVSDPTKS